MERTSVLAITPPAVDLAILRGAHTTYNALQILRRIQEKNLNERFWAREAPDGDPSVQSGRLPREQQGTGQSAEQKAA